MSHEVLLVEDSSSQAAVYSAYLDAEGYLVHATLSGEEALVYLGKRKPAAILLDLQLPGIQGLDLLAKIREQGLKIPVIVITDHGSTDNVVEAMKLGAVDFITKPFGRSRLQVTLDNAIKQTKLSAMVSNYQERFSRERFFGFIGASLAMQALYRIIESAAPSKATVFIVGESGTGKELCAAAVHAQSPRADGPFVAVNCAALPRDLMESEIFGHVKGAFTGAHRQRDGAASLADHGTLFLDEIGEMDLDLQSKLLRFVQTGQFQRVGSGETVTVDVRIVCATNRDPLQMVQQGRFREDLYYRLHVIPISMPPLRERGEDVLTIARHFLQRFAREENKEFAEFSAEAEQVLLRHRWPGNVRELENVVRNVVVLNDGPIVTPALLPPTVTSDTVSEEIVSHRVAGAAARATTPLPAPAAVPATSSVALQDHQVLEILTAPLPPATSSSIRPLCEVEREAIEAAIKHFSGNVPLAAAALQVSPSTIYRKRQAWNAAAADTSRVVGDAG